MINMSAPNFFGTVAVFWPSPRTHPEDDGERYVFCETTDIGQDGMPDPDMRWYNPERSVCVRTLEDLNDLQDAVRWAILHYQGIYDDEMDALEMKTNRY